jgi:hypothetical protein
MRTPEHLSYSFQRIWKQDRGECYLRYLADVKLPRLPQSKPAAIGAAFDALVKSQLAIDLFGTPPDDLRFETLFESQVEPHNRDDVRRDADYVMSKYVSTGFYATFLTSLNHSKTTPRFESRLKGEVQTSFGPVPLVGVPDCSYEPIDGVDIIHDWKVRSFYSRHAASPTKGYAWLKDGWEAGELPVFKRVTHSAYHDQCHPKFQSRVHHGVLVNSTPLNQLSQQYAQQLCIYSWLLGKKPGEDSWVATLDEANCKPINYEFPAIRFSRLSTFVDPDFEHDFAETLGEIWHAIQCGWIFDDLDRDESDAECALLNETAWHLADIYQRHDTGLSNQPIRLQGLLPAAYLAARSEGR